MRRVVCILAVALAACTGSTPAGSPSAPATTTPPATPPDSSPSQTPTPMGTPTALTSSPADAFLRPVSASNADERPLVDGDCQASFRAAGAADTACNIVEMGGGQVYWVINVRNGAYTVQVRTHIASADVWQVALATTSLKGLTLVDGLDAEVAADGGSHLLMAFRRAGEDRSLSYDVIAWPPSTAEPLVVLHRDGLRHGSIAFVEDGLDEFSAVTGDGSRACCPKAYRYVRVSFSGRSARVEQQRVVDPADVPPGAV